MAARDDTGAPSPEHTAQWTALVEEYEGLLRAVVDRFCPHRYGIDRQDIEQEARLRLWRALQRETEIVDRASYLYRVAATAALDALRRRRVRPEDPVGLGAAVIAEGGDALRRPPGGSPEMVTHQRILLERVQEVMGVLGEDQRRALGLRWQGMMPAEIGELLGWSESKARSLVYRALKELRGILRERGIELEDDA